MSERVPSRRILYVCNDHPYFQLHWAWRADAVAKAGFTVAAALPPGEAGAPSLALEELPIALDRKGRNPLREIGTIQDVHAAARSWGPDLIHSITAKPNLYAGFTARRLGLPIACSITGLGSIFTDPGVTNGVLGRMVLRAYRWIARNPRSVFLFENEDDLALFLRADVIPEERALLLPGVGVEPTHFRPRDEPVGQVPMALLPARLLWTKGVGEFVEAARRLRSDGVPVRLAIAGGRDEGNPATIPQSQIDAWKAEGVVEFLGFRTDMAELLAEAAIVCLPSYREGFPRVLIEAASCGRACITTDAPGCRRAVVDGVTGLLVPPRDATALAAAIARLAHAPALRAEMGAAGRRRVLESFTEAHVLESTLDVYARLLG